MLAQFRGRPPEYPVVGVSWKDAYAFCDWLTQREHEFSFLDEGQFYRLPTDEVWEWCSDPYKTHGALRQ
ncbi:MAG: SUMF1/EgtB/PvdO family nonheme iron enzyme [Verrucomicrobia bacterium]|nr:SUMF1/EgtB/PvdO family nonheme iron enzyme [Verrucomicrobiota bacterium]